VPDWIGSFQNPDFPELFAAYAGALAARNRWVRFYTPINEIYITATFSAQLGWWNERLASDRAFVNVRAHTYLYLADSGMRRDEYHFFMQHRRRQKRHCVMGNDYYWTNEHLVPAGDGPVQPSGEIFGYYVTTKQYYDRYHLPVMHTETNLADAERAPAWLWKEWANMMRLKADGVPIIGFTWYSLIDQVDWDTALREDNGQVNPLGLYGLDRKLRPVGAAYKTLVA
jgi:beta-glucosidase/6-phospho-beta-glucosidase/beta-galactosidase